MVDVKDMTLRDWFAGQALIGLLSRPEESPGSLRTVPGGPEQYVAGLAYEYADALLQARQLPNTPDRVV